MQKKLIVAALAGLVAAPVFAQSNVTVYGRINSSFESESQSGARTATVLRDNSSRLGFRGTEDLGNGLKAVFGIESGVNGDAAGSTAGNSGTFGLGRNAYVGLQTGYGTLVAGRLDVAAGGGAGNPTGTALGAVWNDVNNDTGTTAVTQTNGIATFTSASPASRAIFGIRTRTDNSIAYASPKLAGGLNVYVRYARLGTNNGTALASGSVTGAENDNNQTDLSAVYRQAALTVSGAYSRNSVKGGFTAANSFDNRWQLAAGYDFGVVKVGAVYAKTAFDKVAAGNKDDTSEYGLSLRAPFGKSEVIANFARRELQGFEGLSKNGNDRTWQAAYGYNFSTRTRGYAFYQNRDFDTSADSSNGQTGNKAIKTVGLGLRHNF